MPYLVIAFGLVLSCFGGLAMVNGSSIIQIERGWSLFIGGAALLSGGVVTMAVGIALKALLDRVATLAPQAVALLGEAARPIAPPDQTAPALPPAMADPHALIETRGEEPKPFETAGSDRNMGGSTAGEVLEARDAPRTALQPVPPAFDPTDAARQSSRATQPVLPLPPSVEDRRLEPDDRPRRDASMAPLPTPDATDDARTRDRLLRKPSRSLPARPELDDLAAGADEVRESGRNVDTGRAAASAPRKPVAPERPRVLETVAAPAPMAAEPPVEASPEPVPVSAEHAAATEPSVIGRYESEGTSYVMYSDGSIEAQSAAGIYRFASMAELKSFIES